MSLSKVKIHMTGPNQGTIEVDGVQIEGVCSIHFSAGVKEPMILHLHMVCGEAEIWADGVKIER